MRFASFVRNGVNGLAVSKRDGVWRSLMADEDGYPGSVETLLTAGTSLDAAAVLLQRGRAIDLDHETLLPVLSNPGKIICIGLNYADHSAESGFRQPSYPTLFARFNSSLIAHNTPIIRPKLSEQLDYEGELVAVIGQGGKNISRADALNHVAGYSIFNDASIRDYQFKSPQWTMGKNFDSTGAFGPALVTADELPSGCRGLKLVTRLNGVEVQHATIDDMVFDVATQIALVSEAIALSPGDVFVTGTPSGVGLARKPPLWMKHGDVCEVEIDQLGVLRNPVVDET